MLRDGQWFFYSEAMGLIIPFDVYNNDLVDATGIPKRQIDGMKAQLEAANRESCPVPEEFKDKYCILFGGKVFGSFDTLEELEAAKEGDEYQHIAYSVYIPPQHKY